jgi:cytochrome c-type biogenesis protein|tara:strand:- start:1723 stop:2406 length:684 start_codon:yes stop_codon:yes gene_type:complete
MTTLLNFWLSFLAGLSAPIFAVCVLPLYPGFLSIMASRVSEQAPRKTIIFIGLLVTFGVILSMFLFGLIFTFFLQESLTNAIGIISPIAFGILAIISILMIFNFDLGKLFPKFNAPITKNPYWSSFIFGFFFGLIVLPCNPASLTVLFALSTSTISFINNLINFILFGIGMSTPLLLFSIFSAQKSTQVINWLTQRKRPINLIAGLIMLAISLYYLFIVFKIHTLIF